MHNAAGNGVELEPNGQSDVYRSVVSDLVGLIERVQASLRLIERTIDREPAPGSQTDSADIAVLDDISPRFMMAAAALKICDANLGIALDSLMDAETPECGADSHAANRSALSIVWA
jgi:hypothetical protein